MTARAALPDWPRLMSEPQGAAYVSLSVNTFRALNLPKRRIGKRVLYDRRDLDQWADALGGQPLDAGRRKREAGEIERRFLEKRRAA